MPYTIEYSKQAEIDIEKLYVVIAAEYKAPLTAFRYVQCLIDTINSLKYHADVYTFNYLNFVKQYGYNVRRVNYKKMAVFFTIFERTVYIHRIIPSLIITE
jgi:plasmid stabilization system protein ParE